MAAKLLSNEAATGAGVPVGGGTFVCSAVGTFGGATLQLQLLGPDGVTWLDITSATFTAAGAFVVDLPIDGVVRMKVTGGAPSALYADIGRA